MGPPERSCAPGGPSTSGPRWWGSPMGAGPRCTSGIWWCGTSLAPAASRPTPGSRVLVRRSRRPTGGACSWAARGLRSSTPGRVLCAGRCRTRLGGRSGSRCLQTAAGSGWSASGTARCCGICGKGSSSGATSRSHSSRSLDGVLRPRSPSRRASMASRLRSAPTGGAWRWPGPTGRWSCGIHLPTGASRPWCTRRSAGAWSIPRAAGTALAGSRRRASGGWSTGAGCGPRISASGTTSRSCSARCWGATRSLGWRCLQSPWSPT